ncbi:MAG: hypothetical protein LBS91_05990, partial [Clostridiales Family XIII bacterium]|nr:hypothetical protein [Clostridiales Family XIII bacterium]
MEKINTMAWGLNDGTFADGGFNIYATAIPDKSLYAGKYLPGYKPVTARRICAEALGACIQAIDLAGALAARDFYKTDLHWSQPSIFGVADALGETMGFDALASKKIGDSIGTAGTFKGVYAGQLALPAAPDALQYVSNPYIDSASVSYLDPKTGAMAPG